MHLWDIRAVNFTTKAALPVTQQPRRLKLPLTNMLESRCVKPRLWTHDLLLAALACVVLFQDIWHAPEMEILDHLCPGSPKSLFPRRFCILSVDTLIVCIDCVSSLVASLMLS